LSTAPLAFRVNLRVSRDPIPTKVGFGEPPLQRTRKRRPGFQTKSPRRLLSRVAADTAAATRLRQGFGRGKQHYFFEFSGDNSRMNDQVTSAGVVFVVDM